jgi:hydroxymethylbilane synthase
LSSRFPEKEFEIEVVKTTGDEISDRSLRDIQGKGFFVKEIEEALLSKRVDFAVHSMKDVPTSIPDGLMICAVTERVDPRDVLITKNGIGFWDLPAGSKIGTSSLRRRVQILHERPDLQVVDLRGNLDTRIRLLYETHLSAIVVALAGLKRLRLEVEVSEVFPVEFLTPPAGQGSLGIEVRADDQEVSHLVSILNSTTAQAEIEAERAFMSSFGAGCHIPVGVFGCVTSGTLRLFGMIGSLKRRVLVRGEISGSVSEATSLGERLAQDIIRRGGGDILNEYR